MNRALLGRLERLEKKANLDDPLKRLTDDELQQAIDALDASIEAAVGMPAREYAEHLKARVEAGDPMPDGLEQEVVRRFVASVINNRQGGGAADGR